MKKSRIAKLALMGASITALAATLTTSTYAWYVSNQTASVSTTTGSTSNATADGSILVSNTGNYGEFYKSISLANASVGLDPVHTSDGLQFTLLEKTITSPTEFVTPVLITNTEDKTTKASVYHYQFYVMSVGGGTYNPSILVKNKTTAYNPQQCYASDKIVYTTSSSYSSSATTKLSQGQAFYVNALNAMALSYTETPSTKVYGSDGYKTAGASGFAPGTTTDVKGNALSVDNTTTANEVSSFIKTQNDAAISGNIALGGAINYYNAMSNTPLTAAQTAATTFAGGAIGSITLSANTPVRLDYYLYLDGASESCFNACQGQNISIEFTYSKA